jgi:4'-phosphopantetheinyl transferase
LEKLVLPENQVDVWQIHLEAQPDEVEHYRRLLAPDEIERADRFHFEKHRRRFTLGRAAMRQVLGGYINTDPHDVVFSYGRSGKPALAGSEERSIQFNLSHSEDVALLAVARGLALGIDIEFINPEFATEAIARMFFSRSETECLIALQPRERAEAFFCCWTRKESYIKALGDGLSLPLDSFEVAFGPDVPAALLKVIADPREVARWSMYDLEAPRGYRAALVAEGRGHHLRRFLWRPSQMTASIE